MAIGKQNIYRQVYNASDDVNILAGIERVTCVLSRRSMLSAAFNADNELLSVHFVGYNKGMVWDLDFFEQLFSQEPLLQDRTKITKVSFFTSQQLMVPAELFNVTEADKWLRKVQFIDINDVVKQYHLKEDKAYYLYALPMNIEALIKINCLSATIIPLPAYQFASNYTRGVRLHCFLTNDEACVSLYHFGTMLWHRIFDYTEAEDIAYEIRLVCEEHNINADKITMACNTMSALEYKTANNLSQYFSAVTTGSGYTIENLWSPVLSLIKQIESCA